MKLVERDFAFRDLMNWTFVIALSWGADNVPHPWIFRVVSLPLYYCFNYRLIFGSEAASPRQAPKASKRLYHLPGFWLLSGLGAYFAYLLFNSGWLLWVILLCGTLGAGVATFLRLRPRETQLVEIPHHVSIR
jgi:hypothetical protein